jgi:hypothetical protein
MWIAGVQVKVKVKKVHVVISISMTDTAVDLTTCRVEVEEGEDRIEQIEGK